DAAPDPRGLSQSRLHLPPGVVPGAPGVPLRRGRHRGLPRRVPDVPPRARAALPRHELREPIHAARERGRGAGARAARGRRAARAHQAPAGGGLRAAAHGAPGKHHPHRHARLPRDGDLGLLAVRALGGNAGPGGDVRVARRAPGRRRAPLLRLRLPDRPVRGGVRRRERDRAPLRAPPPRPAALPARAGGPAGRGARGRRSRAREPVALARGALLVPGDRAHRGERGGAHRAFARAAGPPRVHRPAAAHPPADPRPGPRDAAAPVQRRRLPGRAAEDLRRQSDAPAPRPPLRPVRRGIPLEI
ncbi:MAG: hypothetical protein AVDCRST_MAG89-1033, partial [uncultured Gemmatimonadetes bacterium]